MHSVLSPVEGIRHPRSPCAREVGALSCRAAVACPCQVHVRLFFSDMPPSHHVAFALFSGFVAKAHAHISLSLASAQKSTLLCMVDGTRCSASLRVSPR